jgi:hypothetical protein
MRTKLMMYRKLIDTLGSMSYERSNLISIFLVGVHGIILFNTFNNISHFACMDVVTGSRKCPINSNKHNLQLHNTETEVFSVLI